MDPRLDAALKRLKRPGASGPAAGACPSAEVLAAWADGGLPARERLLVEAHAADCPRCMDVLAGIVRSAPEAPVAAPWWRVPLRVRWAVPALAAATALALWIRVQSPRPPVPELPAPAPIAVPAAPPEDSSMEARAAAVPSNEKAPTDASARDEERRMRAAAPAPPPPSAAPVEGLPAAPPVEAPAATVTQAPPASPASPGVTRRRGREEAQVTAKAAPVSESPRPVLQDRRAGIEVLSPDASSRWRLDGASIDRSTDGGATWTRQFTARAPLLAGHAPAVAVCWIVGRQGIVLVSPDGRAWRQTAAPAAVDLTGVTAADDRTASVTAADGRVFRTTDAGLSWSLQESPAAPF